MGNPDDIGLESPDGEATVRFEPGRIIPDDIVRALVEESPDAIIVVNDQGRLLLVNRQVEQLFGYRREQLLGQPLEVLVPDGARHAHRTHRQEFFDRPRTRPMGLGLGLEAQRLDGSTFPVEISLTPLATDLGVMVIATLRDTTERKAAAAAQSELAHLRDVASVVSLHRELATAVTSGQGFAGIAQVLRRATDLPVCIEDPDGTVVAWTEGFEPEPVLSPGPERHQRLLHTDHAHAFREGSRLVAVARTDTFVLSVISLVDPDHAAGKHEAFALEQAATVLAMELFRLRSVAESELAVWGDLASELLDSDDTARGRAHARALGYDIDRPHRAVLVERATSKVGLLAPAVRRAAQHFNQGTPLMTSRAAGVVLLVDHELPWGAFADAVDEENGGSHRVGIGSLRGAGDFHQSASEAELALVLTDKLGRRGQVTLFEDLGVWCLLAAHSDPSQLADFVRQWLGVLIDYDAAHQADLTATLVAYLHNDRAYDATAQQLAIHRSTLRYRLGRIEGLSGRDLRDPEHRFNLGLACRAWTTLKAFGDHPGVAPLSPGHPAGVQT